MISSHRGIPAAESNVLHHTRRRSLTRNGRATAAGSLYAAVSACFAGPVRAKKRAAVALSVGKKGEIYCDSVTAEDSHECNHSTIH